MRTFESVADLAAIKGESIGESEWVTISQEDVNLFADATGDHQWIHVDPERAAAESPFGGPVAHGFLTLSLFIPMWSQVLAVTDVKMAVNYGLNKVRFPAPVPAGSRVRLTATLAGAEGIKGGGVQAAVDVVMQLEGSDKPVCVAQMVHRYYPAA